MRLGDIGAAIPPGKTARPKYLKDSRMLKYVLLGLVVVYVAWIIFKTVVDWIDRRKQRKH